MRTTLLATPALRCVVPLSHAHAHAVFDGFGWCESDWLEWRSRDPWDPTTPIDGRDPARMVFVLRDRCDFLPRELARLHAFGLGLTDEWALAPYAIDDATDELFARRMRPRDAMWLAADNLNALFWGLHDWAHFHNHGPFESATQRAWNELQCDVAALAWTWENRALLPIDDARWGSLADEVRALNAGRFSEAGEPWDPSVIYSARTLARTTRS